MGFRRKNTQGFNPGGPIRIKLPDENEGELFGLVLALLGASRLKVSCSDGKERTCRIPGKMKRDIWVREGNYVIVKPWSIEGDSKGDVIWRYNKLQEEWLKKKGHLKNIEF